MEDTLIFLRKVYIYVSFLIASYKQEMRKNYFRREIAN